MSRVDLSFAIPGDVLAVNDGVTILMAIRNGAATLVEQLDSFAHQTHHNVRVLASDDGSSDDSVAILESWAWAHPHILTRVIKGPKAGVAENFRYLFRQIDARAPYVALSDQDDVWLPEKLGRAKDMLAQAGNGEPALWICRTWVCDRNLRRIRLFPACKKPTGFGNALVQNVAPGNSMVLNRAAINLVRAALDDVKEMPLHDWWLYQIITGVGGRVIYDPEPGVLYRQHGRNYFGAQDSFWKRVRRFSHLLFRGGLSERNARNITALSASIHRFTPENAARLQEISAGRHGCLISRIKSVRNSGLYHQCKTGQIGLWVAVLLGRF